MESIFDSPEFSSTMFYPQRRVTRPSPGARDLSVEVSDGARLHLRIHHREGTVATVLLFHGNGEVVSDYDDAADDYTAIGADLAVVDYRGYGASSGRPTLRACLADAHAVLATALEATQGRPLIVMGRSLGSACAAELCQIARPAVRGYLFESGIADVYGVIRRRGITLEGPLDARDLEVFSPLHKFARCTTPTLVLHGADDSLIPASEARTTFDALASTEKELVLIPGRGHNDLSMHPLYWEAMARFIKGQS